MLSCFRLFSLAVLLFVGTTVYNASAATTADDLRKEIDSLRKELNSKSGPSAPIGKVDAVTSSKYGPNQAVTTKAGKLQIGALLQIWNYSIQDDHTDVFGRKNQASGFGGTSETRDNNGYRIRRAEIKFTMDIHENVTGVVMIDPAREATSYAPLPSNQGTFKSKSFYAPEFDAANGPLNGSTSEVSSVQTGAGNKPRILQDAYINYHGVVPHHDFTIGQFKPPVGEEGIRSSAHLDFAERAMVTQDADLRDLGVQVHGTWWDDRFQYWVGAFDGAANYHGAAGAGGQFQNRSDDNDAKDLAFRFLVRPLWNHGPWGSLELGASTEFGTHGEAAGKDPVNSPVNGLNRNENAAIRTNAWAMYKPMGPVRGWWLRGEYGYVKDRVAPNTVGVLDGGDGPNGEQAGPAPFSRDGFYISTGYKLSESVFADRLDKGGFWNNLFQPVEFAFRYEQFGNIIIEDLIQPNRRTDVFKTDVFTAGVNYYIKAYNMRVQLNYMKVNEQENHVNQPARGFEEVENDVLIFTYQVYF